MATIAALQTTLEDNADYAETGSVTKARAFKTALTKLLIKVPQQTGKGSASTTLPMATWEKLLAEVSAWLVANDSRSGANQRSKTFNMSGMRG